MTASPLTELPSPISAQMTKKKSGTRKSTAQRASEREFTKDDKADALLNAIEKIVENNNLLREKCRSERERERDTIVGITYLTYKSLMCAAALCLHMFLLASSLLGSCVYTSP